MISESNKRPKRMGRPQKSADERKSETLRFRVREDLKQRVAAAAASSGRSLSEEAEFMIETFLEYSEILNLLVDQGNARNLISSICGIILAVQGHEIAPNQPVTMNDWNADGPLPQWTRSGLRAGLHVVIDHSIPRPLEFEQMNWSVPPKRLEDIKVYYESNVKYMHDIGIEIGHMFTGHPPEMGDESNKTNLDAQDK